MKRRDFIKASVAAGTAASLVSCSSFESKGKIDCHAHLWPEFPGHIPFHPAVRKEQVKPESFLAEDLMREGTPFGFKRFVLIQHNLFHGFDPSYLKYAAAKYPGHFAVVGSLDPDDEKLDRKMALDAGTVVSGYRVASKDKKDDWLTGKGQDLLWKSAENFDQSVCLLRNRNVTLQSVLDKCKKFPATRVVVDHFGHVDFHDKKEVEVLWALADLPNVYLKVSKFYGNGRKQPPYLDMLPFVEAVVKRFGTGRLMWGSDCPYQLTEPHNYREAYEIINSKAAFLSVEDKKDLFVNTAEKVFFRG